MRTSVVLFGVFCLFVSTICASGKRNRKQDSLVEDMRAKFQWLDDGGKMTKGQGNTAWCVADNSDSLFKAVWTEPIVGKETFYEVKLRSVKQSDKFDVGVTTKDKFEKGYYFNGNLATGSALLRSDYAFGDFVQGGDIVGVLVEQDSEALTVTFYLNGRCLGPAFVIYPPFPSPLYVVVGFKAGGQQATITRKSPPAVRERQTPDWTGLEGFWESDSLPTRVTMRCRRLPSSNSRLPSSYSVSLRVVNLLMYTFEQKPSGHWMSHGGASTLMLGSREEMEIEQSVQAIVGSLEDIAFEGNEGVELRSINREKIHFHRYVPEFEPVVLSDDDRVVDS